MYGPLSKILVQSPRYDFISTGANLIFFFAAYSRLQPSTLGMDYLNNSSSPCIGTHDKTLIMESGTVVITLVVRACEAL